MLKPEATSARNKTTEHIPWFVQTMLKKTVLNQYYVLSITRWCTNSQ